MVINHSPVNRELFSLSFFLLNDVGFYKALKFVKKDSGPYFTWHKVYSKNNKNFFNGSMRSSPAYPAGANSIHESS